MRLRDLWYGTRLNSRPKLTSELAKLPLDPRAVRERQMRARCGEHVEADDLVVENHQALNR